MGLNVTSILLSLERTSLHTTALCFLKSIHTLASALQQLPVATGSSPHWKDSQVLSDLVPAHISRSYSSHSPSQPLVLATSDIQTSIFSSSFSDLVSLEVELKLLFVGSHNTPHISKLYKLYKIFLCVCAMCILFVNFWGMKLSLVQYLFPAQGLAQGSTKTCCTNGVGSLSPAIVLEQGAASRDSSHAQVDPH